MSDRRAKQGLIFALAISAIMVLFMASIMSFIMVAINLGFNEFFLLYWVRSFALGYLFAFPVVLLLIKPRQKIIEKLQKAIFKENGE